MYGESFTQISLVSCVYGIIDVILLPIIRMTEDVYFMYLLKLDSIAKKFTFCCALGYLHAPRTNPFKFSCSHVVLYQNLNGVLDDTECQSVKSA